MKTWVIRIWCRDRNGKDALWSVDHFQAVDERQACDIAARIYVACFAFTDTPIHRYEVTED